MSRVVIVGATSTIGSHCARLWAAEKDAHITLVGRDIVGCKAVAEDLRVRNPNTEIAVVESDLLDPVAIDHYVAEVSAAGHIDVVLICHGEMLDQRQCELNTADCQSSLIVNGVSPALHAETFSRVMEIQGFGCLGLISSVAGDRGRKSNYTYGAAKGLLIRYAQGLQHRFSGTGVSICLIKPGPTRSRMTARLAIDGRSLADPSEVATSIVNGLKKRKRVIYAPGKWLFIMTVIRLMPPAIFNRLNI
jgi:short-subunit dehydrogenase